MNRISVKGVLLGALSAYVVSKVLGLPILLYLTSKIGTPPNSALGLIYFNKILLTEAAINLISAVIGGYIAAFVAKRNALLNGALSSFLALGLGVFSWFSSYPLTSEKYWWFLALATYPLFSLLGGHLRLKQVRKGTA